MAQCNIRGTHPAKHAMTDYCGPPMGYFSLDDYDKEIGGYLNKSRADVRLNVVE